MSFPTSVNDQITDSVTQPNVKVLGDAPAIAMGNLYQATAQALANAAHNATTAQMQNNVTAQAAITQAILQLYSIDTASTGAAPEAILADDEPVSTSSAKVASAATNLEETITRATAAVKEQSDAPASTINKEIEDAVKFTLESNLGSADAFHHAVRAVMSADAASLQEIAKNQQKNALEAIKLAATTMTLKAMIETPDQTETYEKILKIIQSL